MTRLTEMVKLLESNLANLHGAGLDELLAEGKALMASLGAADAKQEQKRLKELPDAVRRFYQNKGELYVGLKVVNDAGHELHADDAEAASRYNLSILYRRAAKPRGNGEPAKE